MPSVAESPAAAHSWLERLNPQQRMAATWGERDAAGKFAAGPLLVIAGAGTGKTSTLAHRVAHLVMAGVDPERILLLTFSRRAAQEMTRRAERLVAQALAERNGGRHAAAIRLPWAGTFHAIGARLLRHYAPRLGLDPGYGILDRGDAADLIDVIRHEQGFSGERRRFPRKDACLAIYSYRVNTGWPLERVLDEHYPWCREWAGQLQQLFRGYVERKQAHGVLDYDDLLLWWHAAVQDQSLAREIGARFDHVLVDEYQDTNALQASILRAIKPDGAGVTVVGDDAQSIYRFRAADVGNILSFPEHFAPPAQRVTLEQNYRSVQAVLDAANALIAEGSRQYPKTLRATRGEGKGAPPRLATVLDDRAQAEYVIREVLEAREAGTALRRQAVLFRSSHHSDVLEVELLRSNIPFVKYGGLKFLESAHVKDLLSVLRWADNPRNGIAAFRALQLMTGIGPGYAQRCLEHLAAATSVPQADAATPDPQPAGTPGRSSASGFAALASFPAPAASGSEWRGFAELMVELSNPATPWPGQVARARLWYQPLLERRYDDAGVRAADLDMLASISGQFANRERFLTELALDPPQASGDLAGDPLRDEDYLVLSTVHSAKGQEWDSVYVLNVADGNFPNEFATGDPAAIEEERRLLYVAITRARDRLHLIEPLRYYVTHQPRLGSAYVHGARSRFLTPAVLACFEALAPAGADSVCEPSATQGAAIDVAATMRGMW